MQRHTHSLVQFTRRGHNCTEVVQIFFKAALKGLKLNHALCFRCIWWPFAWFDVGLSHEFGAKDHPDILPPPGRDEYNFRAEVQRWGATGECPKVRSKTREMQWEYNCEISWVYSSGGLRLAKNIKRAPAHRRSRCIYGGIQTLVNIKIVLL